jgi:hypothetical protein
MCAGVFYSTFRHLGIYIGTGSGRLVGGCMEPYFYIDKTNKSKLIGTLLTVQESGPVPAMAGSDLVVGEDYNRHTT